MFSSCVCHVNIVMHPPPQPPTHTSSHAAPFCSGNTCIFPPFHLVVPSQSLRMHSDAILVPNLRNVIGIICPVKLCFNLEWEPNFGSTIHHLGITRWFIPQHHPVAGGLIRSDRPWIMRNVLHTVRYDARRLLMWTCRCSHFCRAVLCDCF